MNLSETIKNIRASCKNYTDPDLLVFLIGDDFRMGTNSVTEIAGYDINDDDSYEERILKIHSHENIFLPVGMMTFMPIINECDLFCENDYNLQLTQEEFDMYADSEEKLFGMLVVKESEEYIIGKTDVCSCSIDASFEKIEKSDLGFYKKIKEIAESKIIP